MKLTLHPLAAPSPFELWQIDLDAGVDAAAPFDDRLDAQERARAARFAFDLHRRRYVAAHLALRELIARRIGIAAGCLQFGLGEFGKPRLIGTPSCAFSLSHSEGMGLIALAPVGEIGVDLERVRPLADLDALARHCLTKDELRELAAAPAQGRERAFLRGWTRKEACLKALGAGLQIEPHTFEVGLASDTRDVSIDTPAGRARVTVQSIAEGESCVGALALLEITPQQGMPHARDSLYIPD